MADWDPDLYNRFQQYRAEPVVLMLARLALGPNEHIVDLGCGTGEHTVELARRSSNGTVHGIDSSPAMLERARKLHQTLEPQLRLRVSFELADFSDFSAEREYTLVFSNAALQWAEDHRAVLTAAFRALEANGRLAMQVPANDNETAQLTMHQMAAEQPWREALAGIRSPSDENVLSPDEYRRMLEAIGFCDVDCFYHTFRHPMGSPGEVVEFCRSTSLRRFLEPLPSSRRAEFIAEFTRRLETAYGTRGSLVFNFRRLFLWARRPPVFSTT